MTSQKVGDVEIYADILSGKKVIESIQLQGQERGENTFESRQKKYAAEIMAQQGYEIKGSYPLEKTTPGEYEVRLRIVETKGGKEESLGSVPITVSGGRSGSLTEILADDGGGLSGQATHYNYEEKGFAIGMDEDLSETENRMNPNQIVLTGWINAEKGTNIGMFAEIDSQLYSTDGLAELGGSFTITRVPRNLADLDRNLAGSAVRNIDEAGIIIEMSLPFLEAGTHTIGISFNVAAPGAEQQIVDIKPMTIEIDPSAEVRTSADQYTKEWAAHLPKPTVSPVPETAEQDAKTGE